MAMPWSIAKQKAREYRMLKPKELAKAMSFGDDYEFTGNQGEQVKQIGSAWPCRLGQALIQTILKDYAQKSKVTKMEGVP